MRENVRNNFCKEDVLYWVFMNVIIIVALPFGVSIVRLAAETPISFSSVTADFVLAAFSVLFNIGVFIIGEIPAERPPHDSAGDVQNKLAEALVENLVEESRERAENRLLEELREKLEKIFRKYLTESSLKKKRCKLENQRKIEEKEYQARLEEDKRLKRYGACVFFCAAFCCIIYGVETGKEHSSLSLILHIMITIFLLTLCARWGITTLVTMEKRKRHERERS